MVRNNKREFPSGEAQRLSRPGIALAVTLHGNSGYYSHSLTGDSNALTVFKDGLGSDTGHVDTLEGATGIKPADLAQVFTLAERGRLNTVLGGHKEQLVQRVADRLCAWESDLALAS